MNKKLLQSISVVEMLLLLIMGIVSNKISELFEIDKYWLFAISLIIVIGLITITIYKSRPQKKQDKAKKADSSLHRANRLSRKTVDDILTGILYFPAAIFFSYGAIKFSQLVEQNWFIEIIVGFTIASTLFFSPKFIEKARDQKQSTIPINIGFALSLIYGTAGIYLRYSPDSIKTHLLFFAILHSVVLVGLQAVYGYYTVVYSFSKWYDKLPEE